MSMIHRSSRRFTRTAQYHLPQHGRYGQERPRRRIDLISPDGGGIGRNPADQRS